MFAIRSEKEVKNKKIQKDDREIQYAYVEKRQPDTVSKLAIIIKVLKKHYRSFLKVS